MTALQDILQTINSIKKKGSELTKSEILEVLNATKAITKHQDIITSMISIFNTLLSKSNSKIENLSQRELQVLLYIGQGLRSKAIALQLNLKVSTIETHRKNIIKKLNLVGKNKLIEYAILYNLQHQ